MPQHDENDPYKLGTHGPDSEEIDASQGYEQTDVGVKGIAVFLTALAILVAVVGILSYGIGKVINAELNKEDGPNNKWTKTVNVRQLGNLPTNPELQNKMAALTQEYPTPRLQTDDGNQDVADLHLREDLLLDNYTRIDGQPGKMRIPIDRAMELIVQRGLPVAPTVQKAAAMTGEAEPEVSVPLTSGFARTAYEQDVKAQRDAEARRPQ